METKIPAFQACHDFKPVQVSFEEYKGSPQSFPVRHDDGEESIITKIVYEPVKDLPDMPYTTFGIDEITRAGGFNRLKVVPPVPVSALRVLDGISMDVLNDLADKFLNPQPQAQPQAQLQAQPQVQPQQQPQAQTE